MTHIEVGSGGHAVSTSGLSKHFARTRALDSVDLRVPEGAVYVLAGVNGAEGHDGLWKCYYKARHVP